MLAVLDVVFLSRLQFAATIMFHYLYPPLSIGLAVLMVVMEGMFLATKKPIYELMAKFWTKIFAINFGMGVATGIVMEFQFGTNWAAYSRFVGDVFGSALAAEGIFAFFLESGFLALLVFGWDKVKPPVHFLATILVALGSHFSAVWIIVANSWMQTPAGHVIRGDRAEISDFWQLVFNPSSMERLTHVILGAYILAGFFVMSISAWYVLKNRHQEFARKSFRLALVLAALASCAQLLSGDRTAKGVARNQPPKLAAFEGVFHTQEYTPLYLFGIPDPETKTVKMGVPVPGLLSFLVHGDFQTPVPGLDQVPPADQPPLALPFQSYHLMIALGMFFIALSLLGVVQWIRGRLFESRWLLWVFVFAVIGPYVANQAGWVAAEVGRQPWVVYGVMRTSAGVSKAISGGDVLTSLILFTVIYTVLFLIFLYVLDRRIKAGPGVFEKGHEPVEAPPRGLPGFMGDTVLPEK